MIRPVRLAALLALLLPLAFGVTTLDANGESTRMLRSPTVSATHVAFAYANNIWVTERAGGVARRVTSFQGQTAQSEVLAGRQVDRLQCGICREHRCVCRARRWR